jgi:probable HAF family extracellular repeat protein
VEDLGTLGGAVQARSINNHGQVAGTVVNGGGEQRAFVYAQGAMNAIGTFGGAGSDGFALNDSGRVVGSSNYPQGMDGEYGRAFSYANGILQDIGTLPGGQEISGAESINASGQIVGTSAFDGSGPPEHAVHAFSLVNGVMLDIGTLGGLYSYGHSVNDHGAIAGMASNGTDYGNGHNVLHAYLYVNGVMVDLGSLGDLYTVSSASDVNNLGQVVGWSGKNQNEYGGHAFLYQGGSMLELSALIDPGEGWTITEAHAINDRQQIAGTACRNGACYAVRLDLEAQVPEPASGILLLAGLGVMGATARLKRRSRRF